MTPDETDLIRRYIADELDPEALDVAELLILIDGEAAAMVEAASSEKSSRVQQKRAPPKGNSGAH